MQYLQTWRIAASKQITLKYFIFMPRFTLFSGTGCSLLCYGWQQTQVTVDCRSSRNRDTVDCRLRSVLLNTFLLLRLKHHLLRLLIYKAHRVQQNHVATYTCYMCLSIFEFVFEAPTFIYTFRPGNGMTAYTPCICTYSPAHNPSQPTYIPTHPACTPTHQHI